MQAIKRVEIIVSRAELNEVIRLLQNANAEGYTVIEKIRGKGNRGMQDGLGLSNAFMNSMVIWYCDEKDFENQKEAIRRLLEIAGGVCAVSDAQWVKH